MKRQKRFILVLLAVLALVLVACGADEPEVAEPDADVGSEAVTEVEDEGEEEVAVEEVEEEAAEAEEEVVAEAEPVTITYFTFSAAPDHLEDLDQMIAAFEVEHPNIQVEVETAPFDDYFTRLQALIAGGEAPDVFELNYENFVSYAARDVLLDLGPLAESDNTFAPDIFYERAYDAFKYEGEQQALPATFSTVVLYYNQDLFDAAGVEYPTGDWTWEDVRTAAEQINDPEAGVWGLYSPIQFWEFYKKAAQNNCQFLNEERTEANLDDPACVEALETMVSFVEAGVMPGDEDLAGMSGDDLFSAGQVAMDVTGIWLFAAFAEAPFAWDIAVEPGMAEHATHFFANGVAAYSDTPHPEAAWEWMEFFTSSPEMAEIRIDSGWELPTLSNEEYVSGYLEQTPPENREAVFESLNYAITPPVVERQNETQDIVNQYLDQVRLGQLSPEEALQLADDEVDALLAEQ